ncbi:MAG: hypothetical protein GX591_04135 [Planctomycetes bacterium]|nr:hypothetical protein [Planctomycetota bacterium]
MAQDTTTHPAAWDPMTEWQDRRIDWVRVDIAPEDLRRFTRRSDALRLAHALGFLGLLAVTGTAAYLAFSQGRWVLMALALYAHGLIYAHFGAALHELGHHTVFASGWLTKAMLTLYGLLYWPWNPYLYRLSHVHYHHRYTLHQGSDGEDTPNYVELSPRIAVRLFLPSLQFRSLAQNLGRLLTLKPTSKGWRGRGYELDAWERFVLQRASEAERRQVCRFSVLVLAVHAAFVAACLATGQWFGLLLVTVAPFYGPAFHNFLCGTHQHACCQANHPDFRVSCGDAVLDPLSSFLYWHMEYHIEHHMFAGIPCYRLKAFRRFVADQLPPRQPAVGRLFALARLSREKYGTWQNWRDQFGRYKGY